MQQRNASNLVGIAGFVVLGAILAVECLGISGSGRSDMNDGKPSTSFMSASYNRTH